MIDREALLESAPSKAVEYPIDQYNQVVQLYNNQEESFTKLVYLDGSALYMRFYGIQQTVVGKLLLLFTMMVPIFNTLIVVVTANCLVFLNRQFTKVRRNLVVVPNPFSKFTLDNELCTQLGKSCSSLLIAPLQHPGFVFNSELTQSPSLSNDKQHIIIYNRQFENYYFGIVGHRKVLWLWTGLSICLFLVSTTLMVIIIST